MSGLNIKRPKRGDQEDDLLKFQEEFLRNKNAERPAAQVIRNVTQPSDHTEEKGKITRDVKEEKMDLDCNYNILSFKQY